MAGSSSGRSTCVCCGRSEGDTGGHGENGANLSRAIGAGRQPRSSDAEAASSTVDPGGTCRWPPRQCERNRGRHGVAGVFKKPYHLLRRHLEFLLQVVEQVAVRLVKHEPIDLLATDATAREDVGEQLGHPLEGEVENVRATHEEIIGCADVAGTVRLRCGGLGRAREPRAARWNY